jgi:hypothetical protein
LQAFAQWRNDPGPVPEIPYPEPPSAPVIIPEGSSAQEKLHFITQKTFPIMDTDAQLRQHPTHFEAIRNAYPLRNDFSAYTVPHAGLSGELLQSLGFNIALPFNS